jgi:hypothetical protein
VSSTGGGDGDGIGDRNALAPLLAAQQLSVACESRVTAVLAGQPASTRTLVGRVHEQEQVHVAATRRGLRRLGARPSPPPGTDAAIDAELARHRIPGRCGHLRGPGDALALLVDAERAAIGAAYVALSEIHDGRLAVLVAQMMASDAQHEALLDEARHPGAIAAAIPYGVVEGIA